ncbi:intradiol ring-cleavage dioxygenase [Microbacterium invictum]|uniref:Intradiol ring-cleavage dioxygenase n=1 Tax=Microbacterium invictum TaxID=515415 RepID=A0ABZ0VFG4_9MICO|nr:intradiol ring-cleavage dioxygenase [Microbacterium invictum]WQB70537.1 intradiol ring-cleavage dioxygenase [Microbacterium invictum]
MSNTPEPDHTPQGPSYEGRVLPRPEDEVVDQGAGFDVATMVSRRRVLTLVGLGVGAATLAACAATTESSAGSTSTATTDSTPTTDATDATDSTTTTTTTTAAGEIPEETNGPYPADGTNGVNVLEESGIVRSDIRSSLDGGTTAEGVPLTFTFSVTDIAGGDVPFEGAAVYVWHCDAQGLYSMYSEGVEDETFLRGIQVVDANGEATFQTIVPGCYTGRWTHIHFEVYPDVASATDVSNVIATSQVAFPEEMLNAVYELDAYSGSAQNLAQIGGLANDNVFSDGTELQMGTFSGDTSSGYVGTLAVGVDTATTPGVSAGAGGGQPPSGGGPGN